MKNSIGAVCLFLSGLLLGWTMGWISSASTIAVECQRLGGFYVGQNTYECKVKQ